MLHAMELRQRNGSARTRGSDLRGLERCSQKLALANREQFGPVRIVERAIVQSRRSVSRCQAGQSSEHVTSEASRTVASELMGVFVNKLPFRIFSGRCSPWAAQEV